MQTLYVVVASVSGLALGYATAAHFASGAKAALQAKLKDESSALKEAEAKLKELGSGDKKTASKSKGKGKKTDNKKSDTKKLEKQIADANRELERLKDAQMAADKAHADALAKAKQQVEDAKGETAKAVEAAKAEAAQSTEEAETNGESVSAELASALAEAGASLDEILKALIEHAGQTGALLGDVNGIIVAKAGDSDTVESAAAASNTIVSLPQKLEGMLPMNKHFSFQLQDGKNSISGLSFESEGELLALTSVGSQKLNAATLSAVVASLAGALS